MATLPSSLALTTISDGALATAADLRNNFTAIQTENNALLTVLGAGTAGDVLLGNGTTVTFAKPPGYTFAYVEATSVTVANGVAEAAAVQIVSAGAVTFDGATTVDIEFSCPGLDYAAATSAGGINLWDVTTDLGRLFDGRVVAQPVVNLPFLAKKRLTPSVGSHTYNIRIWNTNASNFNALAAAGGAGNQMPAYIKITKA